VLDDGLCDGAFDEFRGRCYEDALAFPTLVRVVRDALVLHGGSANRAIGDAVDADRLGAAPSGVYRKLGNLPLPLSCALLRRGTARLAALAAAGPAAGRELPACVDGLDVTVVDGKKLKRAAKRLLAARAYSTGSLLGGKLLVALSLRSGLAVAMSADADGERNDVPLVGDLLDQLRAPGDGDGDAPPPPPPPSPSPSPRLFVADRQFADLNLPGLFAQGGDHFLLRCTRTLKFEPDPQRPAQAGVDADGRAFAQAWGWIGGAADPRRRYVRRIHLTRATDATDAAAATATAATADDVILITDLLDDARFPAADLLALYRLRWTIEEAFQQVTEVFALARLIGASPRGIIFQAALCLLIYNLTLTVKGYVAAAGAGADAGADAGTGTGADAGDRAIAADDVSTENLFYDLTRELTAWAVLGGGGGGGGGAPTLPPPAPRDAADMRARLRALLGGVWRARWRKKSDKRPRAPRAKRPLPGGHASLWKLMRAAGHRQTRGGA
jgi:hypothetical protein